MPTFNEPGTVYAPSQHEHPVREWTQADLDDFRAGWETLTEERKQFSRDQSVIYANTPEGLLNIRTAEVVEKAAPKKEPTPKVEHPDAKVRDELRATIREEQVAEIKDHAARAEARAKKTRS